MWGRLLALHDKQTKKQVHEHDPKVWLALGDVRSHVDDPVHERRVFASGVPNLGRNVGTDAGKKSNTNTIA